MAWRIGDGRNVTIGEDHWIGTSEFLRPDDLKDQSFKNKKVSVLLNFNTCSWNEELIKEVFNEEDGKKILAMPISRSQNQDLCIWKYTKKGLFTVRSAYAVALNLLTDPNSGIPSPSQQPKEWSKMWKLKVHPRILIFAWKACTQSLPTKANLVKRGTMIDPICTLCGEQVETSDHLLIFCQFARQVWYASPLRLDIGNVQETSFKMLLWDLMNNRREAAEIFLFLAWEIWKARNGWEFNQKKVNFLNVTQKAMQSWNDMIDTNEYSEITSAAEKKDKWEKPHAGKLKLNVDVSATCELEIGMGFVIRDNQGQVILAARGKTRASGNSTLLEATSMRYALYTTKQYHVKINSVESDCLELIQQLNGDQKPDPYCDILINDILMLAKEIGYPTFAHVQRSANQVAHKAAKGPNFICLNQTPSHLVCELAKDL